jgi:hypothetical protein
MFNLLPLNVFHELEVGALGGDLLDRSGLDFVDQVAEDNAVTQDILESESGHSCYYEYDLI